jgi:hypothetical protein
MAIGAIRHCLKIRNQYAHCVWFNDNSGKLAFAAVEDIAQQNTFLKDLSNLPIFYVNVQLLDSQEAYFVYTDRLFAWVNHEGRYRAREIATNILHKPTPLPRPDTHLP